MGGKGLVVATDVQAHRLKEAARRARRSPFRNLTTKPWDGKHVVGKSGTYHGVLVDAPCSAIGTWRRNPDARWTLDPAAVARLAELQAQILRAASAGVRPGGDRDSGADQRLQILTRHANETVIALLSCLHVFDQRRVDRRRFGDLRQRGAIDAGASMQEVFAAAVRETSQTYVQEAETA